MREGEVRTEGLVKRSEPKTPLISVITVVLNGADTIERTIESVTGQTYPNIEQIVIDGGSTDGTVDLLTKHQAELEYCISERDSGIYDAMNKGLEKASGDWFCFLGADDYLWNNRVMERAAATLREAYPKYRVAYGRVMLVDHLGGNVDLVGEPWTPALRRRFRQIMCLPHQGIFHHSELFQHRGSFDTSYDVAGDYELLLRELKNGDALLLDDLIVVGMSIGGMSWSPKNRLRTLREFRRAQRKNGVSGPRHFLYAAIVRSWIRAALWMLMGEGRGERFLDTGRRVLAKVSPQAGK